MENQLKEVRDELQRLQAEFESHQKEYRQKFEELLAENERLKGWALEAIRRERVKCIQDVGNFLADVGTNPAKTTAMQVLEFIGVNRGDPMLPEWAK